jgi:ElaB/YqjD/DUF883 family membrane-anchored ribosome-binding protein
LLDKCLQQHAESGGLYESFETYQNLRALDVFCFYSYREFRARAVLLVIESTYCKRRTKMAAEDDISKDIDQLKKDLAGLRADLGTLMAGVKELGLEQGRSAYERVRESGERARSQAQATQENVEHYIEERPLTSVLVAFGTGFVIGMLLGHRR